MIEIDGNIFEYWVQGYPIVIPTNGVMNHKGHLVMGAGLAKIPVMLFPDLPRDIGMMIQYHGIHTEYLPKYNMFVFPTKYHFNDKSDLELVRRSALELCDICGRHDITKDVYLPKVGTGLGGLKWDNVRDVIFDILNSDQYKVVSY